MYCIVEWEIPNVKRMSTDGLKYEFYKRDHWLRFMDQYEKTVVDNCLYSTTRNFCIGGNIFTLIWLQRSHSTSLILTFNHWKLEA